MEPQNRRTVERHGPESAICHNRAAHPRLLIFDEPFSGFDPINAAVLKREILNLRDKGATVIFSTHNMGSVEELCDRITLIDKSKVILSGAVRDLKRRFSDNRYRMVYADGAQSPAEAIGGLVRDIDESGRDAMGDRMLTFGLNSSDALSQVIDVANRSTSLVSFEPVLPTMDDIFVRAVKENKQS